MNKILSFITVLALFVSIAMNIRLFMVWEDYQNLYYQALVEKYFKEQEVLINIENQQYSKAKEVIKVEAEKWGGVVFIICMEQGCS